MDTEYLETIEEQICILEVVLLGYGGTEYAREQLEAMKQALEKLKMICQADEAEEKKP